MIRSGDARRDSADNLHRRQRPMSDFDFFILLAVAFIGLEIVASFGVLDDNEESSQAPGDG